jgi:drug/metabolite transporter (DMT)-like permease
MTPDKGSRVSVRDGPWGFVFLLAFIGAAIYFVSHSDGSFWGVVLGLLQAVAWPAYLVYNVLLALGA